ncbi:MAG TPA: GIY-YIG nuclease family protein [Patescibacteria group bacterium]|nr:GIY-YIG nuclease family protein [Patescibacteria group bacterium]
METSIVIKRDHLATIPHQPGVYLFMHRNTPIYIGKATHLKSRIISHFYQKKVNPKEKLIFQNTDHIRVIPMMSDFEALLLEAKLIKKYEPKYNVVWKDNKSYLYIKITIHEQYPKIFSTRKENDGESLYFGPFGSSRKVEKLIRELRKISPFCTQKKISKYPCFYSKIGLCSPCPNSVEQKRDAERGLSKKIYRANIRRVITILKGKGENVQKELEKKMNAYKKREDYEAGIMMRDKLFFLHELFSEKSFDDVDIYENIEKNQKKLFEETAHFLKKAFDKNMIDRQHIKIECFDISNLFGKEAVGSMVTFINGIPQKNQYRRFKIKTVSRISDIHMLKEVLSRRFKRAEWEFPHLIVVDGGAPQVRAAGEVLHSLHLDIPLIGFAKNPDRIVYPNRHKDFFSTQKDSLFFRELIRLRNESHRFAKKYHLLMRKKKLIPI